MPSDRYQFPGVHAFVDAGGVRPEFAAKVGSEWFVCRATDAIEQVSLVPPDAREATLGEAVAALDALRACVKTVEAALAHARAGLDMDKPPPLSEPTPERPRRPSRSS